MATGDSLQTISFSYRTGHSTVGRIVAETTNAIWEVLQPLYLEPPNQYKWKSIAADFEEMWNFPNCVGAIDGKHVAIQAPANAGSEFFNYKGFHSINLLAVCDARYSFTLVDVGDSGHHSDGGVFASSQFGRGILDNTINLPQHRQDSFPYVFVADAAFPLKCNLMRPYPGRLLPSDKRIFNYRLSRARRVIENTFGILVTKWRIFRRPIIATPDRVTRIVQATCCLHNFLQHRNQVAYCPPGYADNEDDQGNLIPGQWRMENSPLLADLPQLGSNMHSRNAAMIRDNLKSYFVSTGSVSWQNDVINQ